MILFSGNQVADIFRAPRVCGDDPGYDATVKRVRRVLPAYAGMIPKAKLG